MKLQLLTVFSLLQLSAGNPHLVCEETVNTRIGDNITLTCYLEPEEIIQHEELEVTKVDPDVLVYSYLNGKQFADFYEQYRHRTFLNTEELRSGVVNLKIFSVRQSDEGTYRIYIYTPTKTIRSTVTLIVGNPLLVCEETVETRIGYDVVLPCHMEPKQNIVDDEVEVTRGNADVLVYTYSNGEQLANFKDQYRHRMSVNIEDLKIGVLNLTINSVRKSDNGMYKIYIHKWRISSTVTLIVGVPPPGVLITVCLSIIFYVILLIVEKHKVLRFYNFIMLLLLLVMFTLLCLYCFTEDYRPSDVTIRVTATVVAAVAVAVPVVILVVFVLILVKPEMFEFSFTMKLQLLTVFSLLQLSAGDPRLVCEKTVETRIGDNVVLRCHVEPEEIIQHEAVEVTKVDPDVLVYSYYNGRQFADFYEPYRHRTFLNTEELEIGVVNLKIFSVRQSDEGKFRIHISNRRITSLVTLIVGDPRLVCHETVKTRIGDIVTLPCHLEPEEIIEHEELEVKKVDSNVLVYSYHNGRQLANDYEPYKHRTFLNTEELKSGVLNLKIFSVRQSDEGMYRIHIYISNRRITTLLTVIVGDPQSGVPPSGVPLGVTICVTVAFIVLVVVVGVVVLILVKRKMTQSHSSQQDEDTELEETATCLQNIQQREGP